MRLSIFIAGAAIGVATAGIASAQEAPYLERPVKAPSGAVELAVNAGYTQGFGRIAGGPGKAVDDIASAGGGFGIAGGYRIDPRWMIGINGEYQEFSTGSKPYGGGYAMDGNSAARGMMGGVHVAYHLQPFTAFDPFIQAGTGYRFLWEAHASPAPTILYHGFDWLRLTLGADVRVSPDVAIAPIVGADMNTFMWQDGAGKGVALGDLRLNTFVFAGMQGRFDLGGVRIAEPVNVASR